MRFAIVAGVVVGVAFVLAFRDMERRSSQVGLTVVPVADGGLETVSTVYPAGWACAQLSDGRWECRAP